MADFSHPRIFSLFGLIYRNLGEILHVLLGQW